MATAVKQHQMFVGGEWVDAASGEDPAGRRARPAGRSSPRSPKASAEDVDRAVAAARKAFDEAWFDSHAQGPHDARC